MMADDSGAESLAGLAAAAAVGASQGAVTEDDSLALKVRAWFTEAYNAPLWVRYRREAEEDIGFYVGGEYAWSKDGSTEDLDRIKGQGRAVISINHVQAMVDILTGFERQNRFDPKVRAQGEEDEEDARLMTWLLLFIRAQCGAPEVESEVFEDGVISGASAVDVRVDWTEDPLNGTICLEHLTPGQDVIWDPTWTQKDLSDARYVLKYKPVFVKDLIAQYPDHAEAIRGALNSAEAMAKGSEKLSEFDARDAYGSVRSHAQDAALARLFYDATEDQALVVEAWYRDYEDVWIVANKISGQVHEAESGEAARAVAASDKDNLTAIRRQKRIIKMGVVLPAALLVLEEDDTPYDNDTQAYSIVAYVAKRKRDDVYGMVRNLKDPQRMENKRESQMQDLLARFANMRPMAEENSLANPATLGDHHDPSPIWIKTGHQPPGWYAPQLSELMKILGLVADRNQTFIRSSSGVNIDLLGLREKGDPSGIAIARTQAQGQVIATVFFDNFRAFKKRVNERLARRIQQVFTAEQVFRLTNEVGEAVVVQVNPMAGRGKTRDEFARLQAGQKGTDQRRVFRSLQEFLKYDVVISEAPATPTMRMMQLLGLLEVLRTLPGLAPLMMDKIVALLDVPDKGEILQRVRAMMGMAGGQPTAGPMSSGGGQIEAGGNGQSAVSPGLGVTGAAPGAM
mgnify:CR=1 FL=1